MPFKPFITVELFYFDNLLIKFVSYRLREINYFDFDFDLIWYPSRPPLFWLDIDNIFEVMNCSWMLTYDPASQAGIADGDWHREHSDAWTADIYPKDHGGTKRRRRMRRYSIEI
jgi:hypothetical protein